MNKITVIGSLNIDMVVEAPRIPHKGETILGRGFTTLPGGKGANQAVAAARLGGEVYMVGCVGSDMYGRSLIDNLETNDVNTSNIAITDISSTGVAVIIIQDGDNSIIVDPGANYCLTPLMIDSLEYVIKESYIVLLQMEIPLETIERAVELTKRNGVKILLNPAPAAKLKDEFLKKLDIITPNETESEIITGIKITSIEDAENSVRWFMNKGIRQVVITLGERGAVYNDCDNIIHKSAVKVEAVDTTAAGDSFSGALAFALSSGMDINAAVDLAIKVGALTVTKKGAQASLPTLDEVKNLYKTSGLS